MLGLIVRRFVQAAFSLFILMTLVFFMFRLLPADPTDAMIDASLSPEAIEQIRADFGLDRPLWQQYVIYVRNVVTKGDFGHSFFFRQPALAVLKDKIGNTLVLTLTSLFIAYSVGTLAGALLAWHRGKPLESAGIATGLTFHAAPEFWVGMLFIMIFSYTLGWFPQAGMREPGYVAVTWMDKYLTWDFVRHLILPATVAALGSISTPMLLMRNTMLEVMHEDFVELAKAKGLSPGRIIYFHAARNALLPVVTTFATNLGRAVGGLVLVEHVFSWPGLGREIVLAATRHDYPVAQAAFLLIAALVMLMNIVADIVYGYLDPRIGLPRG